MSFPPKLLLCKENTIYCFGQTNCTLFCNDPAEPITNKQSSLKDVRQGASKHALPYLLDFCYIKILFKS